MTTALRPYTTARDSGPLVLIAAAVVALVVTVLAGTTWPALARSGDGAYSLSGALMCLSDLLVLLAVVALSRTDVVRRGRLHRAGFWLSIAGSAGVVVAEAALRADHGLGNALFGVVGPLQAIGFVVVGIGAIVTAAWSSWRRFVILVLGVYVPAVLVPALAASKGNENLPALAGYHALLLLVGVAYLQQSPRGAVVSPG